MRKKQQKFDDVLSNAVDYVRNFKCYGPVKSKKGYIFWRNYNRELKNGKGKSSFDLCLDALFRPNLLWDHLIRKEENEQENSEKE